MSIRAWFGGGERRSGAGTVADARAGERLRVKRLTFDDPLRSDRLASIGLVVGCELTVRQRRPTFVVELGETVLALDAELARGIEVESVG